MSQNMFRWKRSSWKEKVEVPAAVITTGKTRSAKEAELELTLRNRKISLNDFSSKVISHEIGHSLMTRRGGNDPEHSDFGLMTKETKDNTGKVSNNETTKMLEDAYE